MWAGVGAAGRRVGVGAVTEGDVGLTCIRMRPSLPSSPTFPTHLPARPPVHSRGELTKLGRRMAEFPLDPMLAKTLIASETYKVGGERKAPRKQGVAVWQWGHKAARRDMLGLRRGPCPQEA